jgi:hypothetical protein
MVNAVPEEDLFRDVTGTAGGLPVMFFALGFVYT